MTPVDYKAAAETVLLFKDDFGPIANVMRCYLDLQKQLADWKKVTVKDTPAECANGIETLYNNWQAERRSRHEAEEAAKAWERATVEAQRWQSIAEQQLLSERGANETIGKSERRLAHDLAKERKARAEAEARYATALRALRIIGGLAPCVDNLLSNPEIARMTLAELAKP
ncbi:MAG: hypothetical protein V1784_03735 [bacterium]